MPLYNDVCSFTWLWLRIFGEGAQSVDGINDKVLLQGEIGQSHRLGTVNHEHNVQGSAAFLAVCRRTQELCELTVLQLWVYGLNHKPQTSLRIKLTAATASLPDVVHDITFLQGQKSYYTFHFKHHRLWSILWLNTLTVRPGSPSGPGSPFKRGWRIKWMEKKNKK